MNKLSSIFYIILLFLLAGGLIGGGVSIINKINDASEEAGFRIRTEDNSSSMEESSSEFSSSESSSSSEVPVLVLPNKGDIIKFDAKGDGTIHRFRVLKMTGNNALLMDLTEDSGAMAYGGTTTTQYSDGNNYPMYMYSTISNYCDSTYFNSLKQEIKSAIKLQIRNTSAWAIGNNAYGQLSSYNFKINSRAESEATQSTYWTYLKVGQKATPSSVRCFAIDLDDIVEYFGWNRSSVIYGPDIWNVFGNGVWTHLSSVFSRYNGSSLVNDSVLMLSHIGSISVETYFTRATKDANITNNGMKVQPAFYIDLSQITYQS